MNKDENNAVEIFEENTVITLFDEDEKPIEFYEIASIEHNEKFYELLQPVELVDGIGEDEAVIFEYTIEEGTQDKIFKPIFDEDLLSEVFGVYLNAIADYNCGCECDDCGCDCDNDEDDHKHEDCKGSECDCNHDKSFKSKK